MFISLFFSQIFSCCSEKRNSVSQSSEQTIVDPLEPIIGNLDKVKEMKIFFDSKDFVEKSGYCNLTLHINDKLEVVKYDIESIFLRKNDSTNNMVRITNANEINKLNIDSTEIMKYLSLIEFTKLNPKQKIIDDWKLKIAIPITFR